MTPNIFDRLTDDQWQRMSLGDYDALIAETDDEELIKYFSSCRSHLNDKETFKKKYFHGNQGYSGAICGETGSESEGGNP